MSNYTGSLPKYDPNRRRVKTCPCGKSNRNNKFAPLVGYDDKGKCHSCGIFFPPGTNKEDDSWRFPDKPLAPISEKIEKQINEMPDHLVDLSVQNVRYSNLYQFLSNIFTEDVAIELLTNKYLVGYSKHQFWRSPFPEYLSESGANVFFFLDINGKVRRAKIMLFDRETGKRIKEPFNHINWVHSIMKKPEWENEPCFFGEHQLGIDKIRHKIVCIVESEKSAIMCSFYRPDYIWLATGGKSSSLLTDIKFYKVLEGREIVLFPDFDPANEITGITPYHEWLTFADQISKNINCKISVSRILEDHFPEEMRVRKLDLADVLLRKDKEFGWALNDNDYPAFWDYKLETI